MSANGFYAGYFTAAAGNGIVLFILNNGTLVGVDAGGVQFDGNYTPNESGHLIGSVDVKVPPGVTIIQGITAPPQGLTYSVPMSMPVDFASEPFIELATPFGNVNVRMQKLRDL